VGKIVQLLFVAFPLKDFKMVKFSTSVVQHTGSWSEAANPAEGPGLAQVVDLSLGFLVILFSASSSALPGSSLDLSPPMTMGLINPFTLSVDDLSPLSLAKVKDWSGSQEIALQ
jgi:hypothetical protein